MAQNADAWALPSCLVLRQWGLLEDPPGGGLRCSEGPLPTGGLGVGCSLAALFMVGQWSRVCSQREEHVVHLAHLVVFREEGVSVEPRGGGTGEAKM